MSILRTRAYHLHSFPKQVVAHTLTLDDELAID